MTIKQLFKNYETKKNKIKGEKNHILLYVEIRFSERSRTSNSVCMLHYWTTTRGRLLDSISEILDGVRQVYLLEEHESKCSSIRSQENISTRITRADNRCCL